MRKRREKTPSDPIEEIIYSFFALAIAANGNMILPDQRWCQSPPTLIYWGTL
jgi:hypothetical protein